MENETCSQLIRQSWPDIDHTTASGNIDCNFRGGSTAGTAGDGVLHINLTRAEEQGYLIRELRARGIRGRK